MITFLHITPCAEASICTERSVTAPQPRRQVSIEPEDRKSCPASSIIRPTLSRTARSSYRARASLRPASPNTSRSPGPCTNSFKNHARPTGAPGAARNPVRPCTTSSLICLMSVPDNWQADEHRLDHAHRQPLEVRRQTEDIRCREDGRNVRAWAEQPEAPREPLLRGLKGRRRLRPEFVDAKVRGAHLPAPKQPGRGCGISPSTCLRARSRAWASPAARRAQPTP